MEKIAIIGQGYVGLPLAVAFSSHFQVIGYDIKKSRVEELNAGQDSTKEVSSDLLQVAFRNGFRVSNCTEDLIDANIYIITVPTPVDEFNAPDLSYLLQASSTVAGLLKVGDMIVYESTVYPGCTEEECVPILEKFSGLIFNKDFFVGYSPERINPGDKVHRLDSIIKVTSGSTPEIALKVDELYKTIIKAGTHKAPSIKVAEASKAIENAQRDINISFMNELALIFDKMDIDTQEVLEAASTKFNFLRFKPGLVGGHCISVDPYYLAHKSSQLGYHPQVILSGRRVNDSMAAFIASKVIKLLLRKDIAIRGARILILGFAFKENCPDTRNTKIKDIYDELEEYGASISVYDPWVSIDKVEEEFGIKLLNSPGRDYEAVIVTVAHDQFKFLDVKSLVGLKHVIFDCKSIFPKELVDARL